MNCSFLFSFVLDSNRTKCEHNINKDEVKIMARILNAIEKSFEEEKIGGFSDIAAGLAFLALITAGLSWLSL